MRRSNASGLQCVLQCVLQCNAACCNIMQCITDTLSDGTKIFQLVKRSNASGVAVCVAESYMITQCVAASYTVLQCHAVCCSACIYLSLQCVAQCVVRFEFQFDTVSGAVCGAV